uniref:Uncharacterized protein n=1 Tax=Oryza nivara TaxID=4536 RepID=A0A0E0FME3_ORYNI
MSSTTTVAAAVIDHLHEGLGSHCRVRVGALGSCRRRLCPRSHLRWEVLGAAAAAILDAIRNIVNSSERRGVFGWQPRGRHPEGRLALSAVGSHGGGGSSGDSGGAWPLSSLSLWLSSPSPPSPWRSGGGEGRLQPATTGTTAGGEGGIGSSEEAWG